MNEWENAKVGDCFQLEPGYAFKSADFIERGIPVIKIKNVKAGHFSEHEFSYVDPAFLRARPDKIAQIDDLLISMSGNRHDGSPETWVGKVAHFRRPGAYLINQRVGALRRKRGARIDVRFAGFLLSSRPYQELFIAIATSSGGQANLSPGQILGAPVSLPDIETQKSIAALLGSLDDKINLNTRTNETLEAMAQAIFHDWFVDFGPTRRKVQGATDPVAVMGGLVDDPKRAQRLADLFSATSGDDGLPEGWKPGSLGDIAKTVGVGVLPSQIAPETPYFGLEHMPRRSIALAEWENASKVTSNKSTFTRGQILFGKLRPYFHKVGIAPVDGVCSTDIIVLDAKAEKLRPLVAACVSSDDFVAFTDRGSTGTKMPRTGWSSMRKFQIAIAPEPVIDAYGAIASPMIEKIVAATHESRTLATTRDLLLPKLMSGEIRLRDAVAQLEAAQ